MKQAKQKTISNLKVGEKSNRRLGIEIIAVVCSILLFLIPFYFVVINSLKSKKEAGKMNIKFPEKLYFWGNYKEVVTDSDFMVLRGFKNSLLLTLVSLILLIVVCSMIGFVLQRRKSKALPLISFIILAGLMIPPSIVPTIWVLNRLGLYRSIIGMSLVEVALILSFTTILYRNFMATIPKEIDEAAVVDGCSQLQLFFWIIFPLLKSVTATVVVLSTVAIFNDFTNPLYFLPGAENVTVQLTLYNFIGKYLSSWNLLFADVVIISLPPLFIYLIFNQKIVAGMTAGAVKG